MSKYQIVDWFWIDEDAHVKAIKTTQSEKWYIQFNLPGIGQQRRLLKTRSKKEARIRGWRLVCQPIAGELSAPTRRRTIEHFTVDYLKWGIRRLSANLHARLRAAGITHGTLHVFRHSGATMLANAPVNPMPIPLLQKFLGHRRITTTQVYLHAPQEDVAAALQRSANSQAAQATPTTTPMGSAPAEGKQLDAA